MLRANLNLEETRCNNVWCFDSVASSVVGRRSLWTDAAWAFHFSDSTGSLHLAVFVDYDRKAIALCCPLCSNRDCFLTSSEGLLKAIVAYVFFAMRHVRGDAEFTFDGWVYGALGEAILQVDDSGTRRIRTRSECTYQGRTCVPFSPPGVECGPHILLTLASLVTGEQLPGGEENVAWVTYRACLAAAICTCDLNYLLGRGDGETDEWLGPYTRNRMASAIAIVVDRTGPDSRIASDDTAMEGVKRHLEESMNESPDRRKMHVTGLKARSLSDWCKRQLSQFARAKAVHGQERWSSTVAGGRPVLGDQLTPPDPVHALTREQAAAAAAAAAQAVAGQAPSSCCAPSATVSEAGAPTAAAPQQPPQQPSSAQQPPQPGQAATGTEPSGAQAIAPAGAPAETPPPRYSRRAGFAGLVQSTLLEDDRPPARWEAGQEVAPLLSDVDRLLRDDPPSFRHHSDGRRAVALLGSVVGPFRLVEVNRTLQLRHTAQLL